MFKIIITDEPGYSKRAKQLLEKEIKKAEVVIAADMNQTIQYVKELQPVVVVLAVAINGLNGLEIAKKIREFNSETRIIITSGYDYFEFAQQALYVKASDYLLKPVDEGRFVSSVKKAVAEYEKYLAERDKESDRIQTMQATMKHVEYSFIYTAIFSGDLRAKIKDYKKLLGLGEEGYILNIEIYTIGLKCPIDLKKESDTLYRYLKGVTGEHGHCVVGPLILNRILIYVDTSEKKRQKNTKKYDDIKLSAHILVELQEKFDITVSVGIGSEHSVLDIHRSYEEAIKSLRFKGHRNVVRIEDVDKEEVVYDEFRELENRMLKSVKFGKAETVDIFTETLEVLDVLDDEIRRNRIYELLVLAYHEAGVDGMASESVNHMKNMDELSKLSEKQVNLWAYQKMEYIVNSVRSSHGGRSSNMIKEAIRYIEEHYTEEVSLEEIADYVGISAQHFSKTFKEETGINYIEFLTSIRIEAAKRLLQEGKETIKEICYIVGYNDPNYFSRIFKKVVGVSPSQFIAHREKQKKL